MSDNDFKPLKEAENSQNEKNDDLFIKNTSLNLTSKNEAKVADLSLWWRNSRESSSKNGSFMLGQKRIND